MQRLEKKLLEPVLEDGNNYLHYMILQCTCLADIDKIKLYIRKIGFENARKMIQQQNFKGKIPFDLIEKLKLEEANKKILQNILTPYVLASDVSSVSIMISEKRILQEHKVTAASPLGKNLTLACLVINKTREWIKSSGTHPSSNQDAREYRIARQKIIAHTSHKINELIKKYTSKSEDENPLLEEITSLIKLNKMGNCSEYSLVAKYLLGNRAPSVVCAITKGDHAVLLIDPMSKDAVVCDAWAGRVSSISLFATNLSVHRIMYPNGTATPHHYTVYYHPLVNKLKKIFPVVSSKPILEVKFQALYPKKSLAPHVVLFPPKSNKYPKIPVSPSSRGSREVAKQRARDSQIDQRQVRR